MNRRTKLAAVIFVVLLATAQLIRPDRTNPATDPSQTIRAVVGTDNGLVAVLDRSCGDCHSNDTVWPWYTQIAPFSWLMAYGVKVGRRTVNFSEWASYPPAVQQSLLAASCNDASTGKMPGAYTLVRPQARLSDQDVKAICAAAQTARATLTNGNAKN
jgi:hypothetical protein